MVKFVDVETKRQIDFRNNPERISRLGRTPSNDAARKHEHLLPYGCEDETLYPTLRGDDGARRFFSERGIKWGSKSKYDRRGPDWPARSMLSSQVMCVNFMLPLAEIEGALAATLRAIDDDVEGVVDIHHEGRKSLVEFEWIGVPQSLECNLSRGANSTSVDTFVVAETESGGKRAYLIEWKYTESYSRGVSSYKGKGSAGQTRRRRYTKRYLESPTFTGDVPMDNLLYEPFYQLFRLRLLADRMVADSECGVSDAKVVAVVPEGNIEYRERITSPPLSERFSSRKTVSDVFSATLKEPHRAFATVSPARLLEAVEGQCGAAVSEWAGYMRERYGL